jgi:6-phospho-3-hexuloisomerase
MRTKEESLKYLEEKFNIEDFRLPTKTYFRSWQDELDEELDKQQNSVKNIIKIFLESDRVFTVALGRSNLSALNTGMRLMHLGYQVYEVGHPYTPAIGNDERCKDVAYCVSGSGKTKFVVTAAEKAKEKNVPVIAITSNLNSSLAQLATEKIVTKGKKILPSDSQIPSEFEEPINFLQSKSENKAYHIGDLLVSSVAKMKGITEADMEKRHANTE